MSLQKIDLSVPSISDTHQEVQEYYGARARSADSCCGGDSCCSSNGESCGPLQLYDSSELAALPEDVASFSLGCGNPLAIATLKPSEVVVDLGSGGGLDAFLAARAVGPTGFVYGVDMTDDMLALARRNAEKAGVSNVEFRKGNIEALPLPDNSVDVIISNCVINLSPDKEQTLDEAFRVLKPGGRLAVSDIVIDGTLDDLPLSEVQVRAALHWAGCIAGALTRQQYQTLLAEAGFTKIQVEVQSRYSAEAMAGASELAAWDPALVDKVANRFTSSAVTAVKPE
ncbi:MAG: arsenite methyltransferase [Caldilineaceae bacterium]|nr:arsenite methyltransferase [Caldilineaceae bacterium]